MPSSVYEGARPRIPRIFWYSSGVRLCFATSSGVMAGSCIERCYHTEMVRGDKYGENSVPHPGTLPANTASDRDPLFKGPPTGSDTQDDTIEVHGLTQSSPNVHRGALTASYTAVSRKDGYSKPSDEHCPE